eukprot:11186192-Lingulodinium_polyedra.AAC.1
MMMVAMIMTTTMALRHLAGCREFLVRGERPTHKENPGVSTTWPLCTGGQSSAPNTPMTCIQTFG